MFYDQLLDKSLIHAFQFLYYFSSFWGQFGPNATTWLLPAELNPTEVRSACHGFSAAIGKAGALVAGVIFGLCSDQAKFIISAACGAVGAVVTYLFIPDLTGLDLREGDKRWLAIIDGKHDAYHGEAVNPKHLSLLERMLGYGKLYRNPVDPRFMTEFDSIKGDHHTRVSMVGGLVVGTFPIEGEGPDEVHQIKPNVGKEASFQAKSLEYL